jgi:hypothetical protein
MRVALALQQSARARVMDALPLRAGTLVWLNVHPRFDALRSEPRFVALVKRMGLD